MCNSGLITMVMLYIWIIFLGTEGFLQHLMKFLRLPESCPGLVPGKWFMRTQRCVVPVPGMGTAEHFWYPSAASLFPGCSLLLATLLPYTSCSRTAMEMLKLSTRAEGIFTLFFLVLSHRTQLFLANALWSLGSVYNMRDLLSEYQCYY